MICGPASHKQLCNGATYRHEALPTGNRSGVIQLKPVVTPSSEGAAARRRPPWAPPSPLQSSNAAKSTHERPADGPQAAVLLRMPRAKPGTRGGGATPRSGHHPGEALAVNSNFSGSCVRCCCSVARPLAVARSTEAAACLLLRQKWMRLQEPPDEC